MREMTLPYRNFRTLAEVKEYYPGRNCYGDTGCEVYFRWGGVYYRWCWTMETGWVLLNRQFNLPSEYKGNPIKEWSY